MINGLLIGWFLTLFGFDHIFLKGLHEMFNINATDASYYLFFFILGVLYDVFHEKRGD